MNLSNEYRRRQRCHQKTEFEFGCVKLPLYCRIVWIARTNAIHSYTRQPVVSSWTNSVGYLLKTEFICFTLYVEENDWSKWRNNKSFSFVLFDDLAFATISVFFGCCANVFFFWMSIRLLVARFYLWWISWYSWMSEAMSDETLLSCMVAWRMEVEQQWKIDECWKCEKYDHICCVAFATRGQWNPYKCVFN